jgi:DNA-binding beta-propeller fold protein YncE
LVLDTETGKTVASLDIVGDTDDVFYDPTNRRIYATGGEGYIAVINQTDANKYRVSREVATALGARTSFFAPGLGRFYLAVPRRSWKKAELRVFSVAR